MLVFKMLKIWSMVSGKGSMFRVPLAHTKEQKQQQQQAANADGGGAKKKKVTAAQLRVQKG